MFKYSFKPLQWLLAAQKLLIFFITLLCSIFAWFYFFPNVTHDESTNFTLENPNTTHLSYNALNPSLFKYAIDTAKLKASCLKDELIYLGYTERPDFSKNKKAIFLGMKHSPKTAFFIEEEPVYVKIVDGDAPLQFVQDETLADLVLSLKCKDNDLIVTIKDNDAITLKKEIKAPSNQAWEIGKHKADSMLLSKQHAKWVGRDLFLERHGGSEYEKIIGCERIDFDDGPSCFIKDGHQLVWMQDHWQVVSEDLSSKSYSLLTIRKMEEKYIHFTLWDANSPLKYLITLGKYNEIYSPTKVATQFRYVGAKSFRQWIFEINGKRQVVKEGDWWLYTNKEWKLLKTSESIDDYVARKLKGELLVIDKVQTIKGKRMLLGHIFSPNRVLCNNVELPMQQVHFKPNIPMVTENEAIPSKEFDDLELESAPFVNQQPDKITGPPRGKYL